MGNTIASLMALFHDYVGLRRVGGIRFLRIGRLRFSFCVARCRG